MTNAPHRALRRRATCLLICTAAGALALGACSGDDDESAASGNAGDSAGVQGGAMAGGADAAGGSDTGGSGQGGAPVGGGGADTGGSDAGGSDTGGIGGGGASAAGAAGMSGAAGMPVDLLAGEPDPAIVLDILVDGEFYVGSEQTGVELQCALEDEGLRFRVTSTEDDCALLGGRLPDLRPEVGTAEYSFELLAGSTFFARAPEPGPGGACRSAQTGTRCQVDWRVLGSSRASLRVDCDDTSNELVFDLRRCEDFPTPFKGCEGPATCRPIGESCNAAPGCEDDQTVDCVEDPDFIGTPPFCSDKLTRDACEGLDGCIVAETCVSSSVNCPALSEFQCGFYGCSFTP